MKKVGSTFEIYRMVPPGKVAFAFCPRAKKTIPGPGEETEDDSGAYKFAVSEDYDVEKIEWEGEDGEELFGPLRSKFGGPDGITHVNRLTVLTRAGLEEEIRLRPRTKANEPVAPKKKNMKQDWTLKNSVFAAYVQDTKKHVKQAFESDYNRSKARKLENKMQDLDEKEIFRRSLLEGFPIIKNVFRHYAAAYTTEVWSLGVNAWNQFISDINVIDEGGDGDGAAAAVSNKVFNRVEADLIFVSACATGKKTLNRHEFLDAICQVAASKYIKFRPKGKDEKRAMLGEAVKMLSEKNIETGAERDTEVDFRKKYLYNKRADNIYRDSKQELMKVFKKFSGKEDKPGEAKTMSMSEYLDLLEVSGLDTRATERSVKLAFVRSKETVLDETDPKSKSRQLKFVEFLESIGRLAAILWREEGGMDFMGWLQDVIAELIKVVARKKTLAMAAAAVMALRCP